MSDIDEEKFKDKKGMMAKVQTLGDRPKRPFEVGAEVYLATEEQISKILGISNPPDESVALGKLLGYPFEVFLAVKNFGRIFITNPNRYNAIKWFLEYKLLFSKQQSVI